MNTNKQILYCEQKIIIARNNPSNISNKFSDEEKEALATLVSEIISIIRYRYFYNDTAIEIAWEVLATAKSVRDAFKEARSTNKYTLYIATRNLLIKYIQRAIRFGTWKIYNKNKKHDNIEMYHHLASTNLSPLEIAIHNEEREILLGGTRW